MVLLGPTAAQETAPRNAPEEVEFQRVFVPEDRSADWPRAGFSYAPQIPIKSFEDLIEQARDRLERVEMPPKYAQAELHATLEGNVLTGRCLLVPQPNDSPLLTPASSTNTRFIPLGDTNLAFQPLGSDPASPNANRLGLNRDQPGMIWSGDDQEVEVQWRFHPSLTPDAVQRYDLRLPNAQQSDLYLDLPADHTLRVIRGAERTRDSAEEADQGLAQDARHLVPDWTGRLTFEVTPSRSTGRPTRRTWVVQNSHFRVRGRVCESVTRFNLVSGSQLPRELTLAIPTGLVVTEVLVGETPLETTTLLRDAENQRLLRLDLSGANLTLESTLRIEATSAIGGQESSEANEEQQPFELPLMNPIHVMRESFVATVEIDETQNLSRYETSQAEPLGLVPHNSVGQTNLRFRLHGRQPRVALHLVPSQSRIVETAVHHIEFDEFSIRAITNLRVQPVAGEILACTLPLGPGWQVDQVLDRARRTPVRWDQIREEGSQGLRIDLAPGREDSGSGMAEMVLEIEAHRTREKDFGNFILADLQPLLLNPRHEGAHWMLLMRGARYNVVPDTDGVVAAISPAELSAEDRLLIDPEAEGHLFPLAGAQPARHEVRVSPKTVSYHCDIQIEARVTPNRLRQEATLRLEGEGHAPQRMTLWSTRPLPADTAWMINGGKPARLLSESRLMFSDDESRQPLFAYELELGTSFTLPLQLEGSFHQTTEDQLPAEPILLSVATAENQTGQITVRTSTTNHLVANPRMLRSLYNSGIDWQADNRVLRFAYRPLELPRLADNMEDSWLFRWEQSTTLPEAYCLDASHHLHLGNDAVPRYHSQYLIGHRDSATLRFQLPEESRFLFAEVDGVYQSGQANANGGVEIRLPRTPGRRRVDLFYEANQSPLSLFGRVTPRLPEIEMPLGRQRFTLSVGTALRPLSFSPDGSAPPQEVTLSDRLWGGVMPGGLLGSGNGSKMVVASPDQPATNLNGVGSTSILTTSLGGGENLPRPWIVRQSAVVVAGYAILLLAALVAAVWGRCFPRFTVAVWVVAVAIALVVPPLFVGWSSGLVVGLTLGAVIAWFRPWIDLPARVPPEKPIEQEKFTLIPSGSASRISGYLVGWIVVGLATASTWAQPLATPMTGPTTGPMTPMELSETPREPTPLATPRTRVIYPVLIPIDSRRNPVGQAYLPQPFYEYLTRMSQPAAPPRIDYLIETIGYEFKLPSEGSTEIVATTRITLTTFRASLALALSIDPKLGENVQSIFINEGIQPGSWETSAQALSVVIREAGKHQLEIQSRIPTENLDATRPELELASLRCPSTSVRIDSARQGLVAQLETSRRVLGPTPNILNRSIELGPIDQFKIRWNMPEATARFEYDQLDLLNISEDSVQLRVRLLVKSLEADAQRINLAIDPRLSLVTATIAGSEVTLTRNSETSTYTTTLPTGTNGSSTSLDLLFNVRGAQRVANLLFPGVSIPGATVRRRWAAVSATDDLQVQSDAESRVAILSQDEFTREWKSPVRGFRFAVSLVDTSPLEWVISTRPIATRTFAQIDHQLTFDEDGHDFQILATVETYSGRTFQYVADIGAGHRLTSVDLFTDGLKRPLQWHYNSATGKLGILLLEPVDGDQELLIRGRHPRSPVGAFAFRPTKIEGVQSERNVLTVSRKPSVLVGISDHRGLTPEDQATSGIDSDQPTSRVGRFRLENNLSEVPLEVSRNDLLLTGDMLTIVSRNGGNWRVDGISKLDVRAGTVDYLDLLVPPNQTLETERMDRFTVSSRLSADQSLRVYRLIPKRPLGVGFSLRVPMSLEVATGEMVEFGPIRIVGQPHIKQFAATPEVVGNQEVFWASRALLPNPGGDLWFQPYVPRGFQLLGTTHPNFSCQMVNRMTASGTPDIPLLHHQAQVDAEGEVLALATARIVPNGQQSVVWQLPPDWKVLGVFLEEEAIPFTQVVDGGIAVELKSRKLPQTVSVMVSGKLTGASSTRATQTDLPLPELVGCKVRRTLLDVTTPDRWRAEPGTEITPEQWLRDRLLGEMSLKTLAGDEFSGLQPPEVARWRQIRRQRGLAILEEIQTWFRAAGTSEQTLDREIQGLFGEAWPEIQAWLIPSDKIPGNSAPSPKDQPLPIAQLPTTDGTRHLLDLTASAESEMVSFEVEPQPSQNGNWWAWLIAASLVLVGCTVVWIPAHWTKEDGLIGGSPLASWVRRWPQVIGVTLGIIWYLFLPPHEFGLILATLFALASLPIFRPRWQ